MREMAWLLADKLACCRCEERSDEAISLKANSLAFLWLFSVTLRTVSPLAFL
ncbi:hypothetical protein [Anaeromusa sp.]|uniref:hypothetical protein n=1 Tax=Anaeromusa sp. TaxID=1872520 RepID=UPI002B200D48|nr:hypothetical protein [Anaeromusa sp.]